MRGSDMRGIIDDLPSPVPLLPQLPGILQDDEFLGRWLEAFDTALAPVFAVLDNLDAYVRPATTPPDFLAWLAEWVDARLDDAWELDQARQVVAEAAGLLRRSGTLGGIRAAMRASAGPGSRVEVEDTGGVAVSPVPRGTLPGRSPAEVHIAVTVQGGAVPDGAVQGGAVQDGAVQGGAVHGGAVQGGAVHGGAVPAGDRADLQRRLERAARQFVPAHVRCVVTVTDTATDTVTNEAAPEHPPAADGASPE